MAKFKRNTHFVAGFNFQGKRESNTGEDVLTVHIDTESDLMDGTPLNIKGLNDPTASIASDDYVEASSAVQLEAEVAEEGDDPDLILYSRISDELTDFEWVVAGIERDEVKPGDPATAVLKKESQIIATRLVGDNLDVDDDVAINDSGEYEDVDSVSDTPETIGECVGKLDSPDFEDENDDFYLIVLK